MRSRTFRLLTLTTFALALLLAGPVLAEKQEPAANLAADVAAPQDLAPRPARVDPGHAVPGPTGTRSGFPNTTAPIDYDSPADFSEGFDDITLLPAADWFFDNNSNPLGLTDWFQGNDTVFPAHAGAPTAYIGANFNNTSGAGTISNWMLTPEIGLADGDTISFWTRTVAGSIFPDRLQVRLSTAGASVNVGTLATDVGDFTTMLLEINPTLIQGGYPEVWTQFSATLSGIPAATTGRIGFRYFVTDGGPAGNNSDYIGIDTVEFTEAPAGLTMTKTVGTVPATCAATDAITVPFGTPVYYCFTVENTTALTLNFHDLVDDHLGTILSNVNVPLAPAATFEVIEPDTATATVTNTATWTARDQNPGYAANDTAPFSFIDISATGTALGLTDDSAATVTMPFPFTYFGVTSADMRVGNNGGILFGVTTGELGFSNAALPVATPALSILPFWDDMDEETGNVYFETQGVAPNRQFIVEWFNRPHFPGPGLGSATFEVIFFEGTNEILFQYLDTDFGDPLLNAGISATAGLNQDATLANQYSFNTAALTDSKAILWTLGTVTEVTATDTATVTVTAPDIVVTPASLASLLAEGDTETLPLDIENIGTGNLDWTVGEAAQPLAAGARRVPEAVLYDNGPIVTHPGGGFGGADASSLQTALSLTLFGFGHQIVNNNRMADDFTVPAGSPWTIDTITFYAYQTGSTTTSTFTDVRVQIWDGPPMVGGSNIVFGDLVTNRLASSTFSNVYRALDTTLLDNARPIMANVVTIGTTLPPGTYWLDWFAGGTLASGPWAPPVTVLGQTATGNGMQSIAGAAFTPALDGTFQQDMPFVIEGTSSPCATPSLSLIHI